MKNVTNIVKKHPKYFYILESFIEELLLDGNNILLEDFNYYSFIEKIKASEEILIGRNDLESIKDELDSEIKTLEYIYGPRRINKGFVDLGFVILSNIDMLIDVPLLIINEDKGTMNKLDIRGLELVNRQLNAFKNNEVITTSKHHINKIIEDMEEIKERIS